MSTNESDTFAAKMRDPLSGTTRCFVTAEALVGAWVQGGHGMTEYTYTREDMVRAWDEGYRARGADAIYTGLTGCPSDTPNPYEQEES